MGDLRSREMSYSGSGMSGKLVWVKEVEQRVESQLSGRGVCLLLKTAKPPWVGLAASGYKPAMWLGGQP